MSNRDGIHGHGLPHRRSSSVAALALLFVAGASLALGGCRDVAGPGEGFEPITDLPRDLTVDERSIIAGSNAFGFELLGRVVRADARPNLVLSPLSASMALGMTANGAEGVTYDEMRQTLGFGSLARDEINASYRQLMDILTDLDPEVRFDVANAIWANEDVPFHDAFFQTVAAAFDARAESWDFADPTTLAAINAWVRESTGGLIDSILDDLDPELAMLIVNAIYFEGSWTTQFDPADTRLQAFTRADDSTVEVEMMSLDAVELPMGYGPGHTAVELPYGGEAFSMVVVVPSGDARAFAETLDSDAWDELVAGLRPQELDLLQIPKLSLTYDGFLNGALKAMGMDAAFGPGADFTRMSPIGDMLCIDFVRQKALVEVDEQGTRAAAVTSVGIGVTSFTGLVADRPFLFVIRERLSGTVLFVGLVGDPTAGDPGPEPFVDTCGA